MFPTYALHPIIIFEVSVAYGLTSILTHLKPSHPPLLPQDLTTPIEDLLAFHNTMFTDFNEFSSTWNRSFLLSWLTWYLHSNSATQIIFTESPNPASSQHCFCISWFLFSWSSYLELSSWSCLTFPVMRIFQTKSKNSPIFNRFSYCWSLVSKFPAPMIRFGDFERVIDCFKPPPFVAVGFVRWHFQWIAVSHWNDLSVWRSTLSAQLWRSTRTENMQRTNWRILRMSRRPIALRRRLHSAQRMHCDVYRWQQSSTTGKK